MQIVALPSAFADQLNLPRETQSLARYNLMRLSSRLDRAVAAAGDDGTRAHLVDLRVRVNGVLRRAEHALDLIRRGAILCDATAHGVRVRVRW